MERTNGEAGEVLASLSILSGMSNGRLEFGNRICAEKKDDVVIFSSLQDNTKIDVSISLGELQKIQEALKAELLVKKSMRGKMEYNAINKLATLLGSDNCLIAPIGRIDDFVLNGEKINFKASIQNKAGVLHYSKLFAFSFNLRNVTDDEAQTLQSQLRLKKTTPSAVLQQLIKEDKVYIVPDDFGNGEDVSSFYNFLLSLDKTLPYVYQQLKYKQIELGKHKPKELLSVAELDVFKKFVQLINQGLTPHNFENFQPEKLSLIVMTRQLDMIYHSLSNPEDITWMIEHLYIDSGDSSRTGSGRIYKQNGTWKMSADIYFKFDYHA